MSFLIMLLQVAQYLLWVLSWIIIIQAILSWLIAFNVINTYNDFVRSVWQTLEAITRPIYRPIRRIMPDFGALDLSPLVALLLIIILKDFVLNWAIAQLAGAIY
ncbi:YggT family protein [Sphingomonas kyeonggiensis]|nr:YggT family protein [Sphingomonas kyeonggiensis]